MRTIKLMTSEAELWVEDNMKFEHWQVNYRNASVSGLWNRVKALFRPIIHTEIGIDHRYADDIYEGMIADNLIYNVDFAIS